MHAMPRGGEITVDVRRATAPAPGDEEGTDRDWIRVGVRDQGSGIEEETRRRLFEPFFTTKETGKGTGLGLAVCADIAQEHGGWMEVESQEGQGSCFLLVLPQRQGAQSS
jgi:signal transduction histidine kinase